MAIATPTDSVRPSANSGGRVPQAQLCGDRPGVALAGRADPWTIASGQQRRVGSAHMHATRVLRLHLG